MIKNSVVSIIIPVFNIAAYISRCIESVRCQTYENLEIILVDDGSTDQSGDICEQYQSIDQRIKVLHKKNGGLSDARNAGLDIATGDYIAFIDGDDFVTKYYIENLYKAMELTDADMASSGFVEWYEGDLTPESLTLGPNDYEVAKIIPFMEKLLYQDFLEISVCYKLYPANFFRDMRFPVDKLYEDIPTTWAVLKKCNSAVIVYRKDYMYYQRKESIQHISFSPRKMDCVIHWKSVLEDVEINYPQLYSACCCRYLSSIFNILFQIPGNTYSELQNELWNEIMKYRSIVIHDSNARKKTRYALCISYTGKTITRLFYKMLNKVFAKFDVQ